MTERSASMPEMKALRTPRERYDVAILGGGLAGLDARSAHREDASGHERRSWPRSDRSPLPRPRSRSASRASRSAPTTTAPCAGSRTTSRPAHLRKAGLRFFMPAGDNSDITKRVEFAHHARLQARTHQIDRGVFENDLFDRAPVENGVDAFRGYRVAGDRARLGGGRPQGHG